MAANKRQLRRTIPKNAKARFYIANTGSCTNPPLGFQQGKKVLQQTSSLGLKDFLSKPHPQKTKSGIVKLLTITF